MEPNKLCQGMEIQGNSYVAKAGVNMVDLGYMQLNDEDDSGRTVYKNYDESVMAFC